MSDRMAASVPTMPPTDEWRDYLLPDESIVWQGRPGTMLRVRPRDLFQMLFGAAFTVFALFWMIGASQAGGHFWMFGLLHFGAGLALTLMPLLAGPFMRRRSFYTLTTQRALIASDMPLWGRRLDAYPLKQMGEMRLEPGKRGSVWFAERPGNWALRTAPAQIGFEFIADAAQVFSWMAQLQGKRS